MRGAQLTAVYTVNTYSKPLYYTLGAVAPLLLLTHGAVLRTAHTLGPGGPLPHADRQRDARQTRLTNQRTGQQPFCQYPAVSWELQPFLTDPPV